MVINFGHLGMCCVQQSDRIPAFPFQISNQGHEIGASALYTELFHQGMLFLKTSFSEQEHAYFVFHIQEDEVDGFVEDRCEGAHFGDNDGTVVSWVRARFGGGAMPSMIAAERRGSYGSSHHQGQGVEVGDLAVIVVIPGWKRGEESNAHAIFRKVFWSWEDFRPGRSGPLKGLDPFQRLLLRGNDA